VSLTPVQTIIRAFPKFPGQPEQFYDVTKLPWKDRQDFGKELEQQGYYVQDIMLADPMPVMIGVELRRKYAEAAEK
jgi:hypothetical protein